LLFRNCINHQHIFGHTQVKTTQRYAHLSHETLLAATKQAIRWQAGSG
jgi:site-specific recombinase XerD